MEAAPLSIKVPIGEDEFSFLRRMGMEYIQRFGKNWTDHNEHDPGITILEQLCYALTDLHYRIDYDMPDLLASMEGDAYQDLFSPRDILTVSPVTVTDMRKVILDIPEVKNAWIEIVRTSILYEPGTKRLLLHGGNGSKDINGLYKIWIDIVAESGRTSAAVISKVMERIAGCRPLCEDFTGIEVIKRQKITLKATLEIGEVDDPELLIATIYQRVHAYMSPSVTFHTLQEMQQKGFSIEEIMQGPALDHGFIDESELPRLERKKAVFVSDIINVLYDVPGLLAIRNIQLKSGAQIKDWKLDIAAGQVPVLDNNPASDDDILLQKNGMPVRVNKQRVAALFSDLQEGSKKRKLPDALKNILPPVRDHRFSEDYYSIQNHFPAAYALREGELSDDVNQGRKIQRDQLRAYLLFFDQILANQFSQVAHLKDIFSYANKGTYFTQQPSTAPSFDSYINDWDMYASLAENEAENRQRKNRVLNHLLARFAEDYTHFSLLLPNLAIDDDCFFKGYFLQNYPTISGSRGCGIDYLKPDAVGGLERRIRIKMGIKEDDATPFYVIEHILLRPSYDDSKQQPAFMQAASDADPFSLHVSFVMSDSFVAHSSLLQTIIREETPAHVSISMNWLTKEELSAFAPLYKLWRNELAYGESRYRLRGVRNRLIDFMNIGITYPISDLPVKELNRIVPYGYKGKFIIQDSELDVRYELYRINGSAENKTAVSAIGTGEDLLVETEELNEDSQFIIYALKESDGTRFRVPMNARIGFEIGIDKNLTVNPVERNVPYGGTSTIRIANSQDKVVYKLFGTDGAPLSASMISSGGELSIVSFPLYEDTRIILKASKSFSDDEDDEDENNGNDNGKDASQPVYKEEVVDITALWVPVMPDLTLKFSIDEAVLPYGGVASISIEGSQASVLYQVKAKPFDENHILYATSPEAVNIQYASDLSDKQELSVSVPSTDTWQDLSPLLKGNGSTLIIETEPLSQDVILFVRAVKERVTGNDDVLMEQKLIVLVRPRMDISLDVPATVSKGSTPIIVIQNPERGVVYQLIDPVKKDMLDQQVFHKNKSVEQARLGIDMVVGEYSADKVMLYCPPISGNSRFTIKAVKMYTYLSDVYDTEIVIGISSE